MKLHTELEKIDNEKISQNEKFSENGVKKVYPAFK